MEPDDLSDLDDLPIQRSKKPRGTPAGSAVPRSTSPTKLLTGFGRAGEPLSPAEARRQLYHSHVALAKALGSSKELRESDFETQGDALADMSNHIFPAARLVVRAVTPMVFIGAEIGILGEIIDGIEKDAEANQWRVRFWAWLTRKPRPAQPELYVVPLHPGRAQAG
jgi:hypothetical protein